MIVKTILLNPSRAVWTDELSQCQQDVAISGPGEVCILKYLELRLAV
jgi:hypothetical protein